MFYGQYCIAGIFGASSWKNFHGRSMLNHTTCTRGVEMVCLYFEVEAMVRGYYQYKEIWDAKVGEELECQRIHIIFLLF